MHSPFQAQMSLRALMAAFTFNDNGQLHMLYKDNYFVVAFSADPYTNDKNAQLDINIGRRILANLKEKL